MNEFRTILGINYFVGSLPRLVEITRLGGMVVVPAAPALAELEENTAYREALEVAKFAITDSSFLIILWFLRKGEILRRISGLQYLRALIRDPAFRAEGTSFWIMPSSADMEANLNWLNGEGLRLSEADCYLAPHYQQGKVEDKILLARLEELKPQYVVINVGGGTQEILGAHLQSRLSYRPAIICTGAAIAFLSGRQANIYPWVDKMMLGWFARCLSEPGKFVPRYIRGFRLTRILLKYAERPVSVAKNDG